MNRALGVVTLAAAVLSTAAFADDCDERAPRQLTVALSGATSVKVVGGAGSLEVKGVRGAADVRASGTACASSKALLDQTVLKASRKGNELVIEAVMPDVSDSWFFGMGGNRRLDFTVSLPDNLPVYVVDGSGAVEVESVGSLKLRDGSGEIEIRNIAGKVDIEDGSGEMTLSKIGGPIEISDGSGEIDIREVSRDVVISTDGSGSIDIRGVKGNVTVDSDGSGEIDVREVTGDYIVHNDGSGGINYVSVGGKIRLPRDDR